MKNNSCMPFSQNDILTIRGEPVVKLIKSLDKAKSGAFLEEWTYYNKETSAKESYVFKNGQLVKCLNMEMN